MENRDEKKYAKRSQNEPKGSQHWVGNPSKITKKGQREGKGAPKKSKIFWMPISGVQKSIKSDLGVSKGLKGGVRRRAGTHGARFRGVPFSTFSTTWQYLARLVNNW